jgi:nitric oxide reductase subunit C
VLAKCARSSAARRWTASVRFTYSAVIEGADDMIKSISAGYAPAVGETLSFAGATLRKIPRQSMASTSDAGDPAFWRAGAIATTIVMLIVLVFLTVDSLVAIRAGGSHVPRYSVINREIGYAYDARLGYDMPVLGSEQPLFGRRVSDDEAQALIAKGKLVIQSRACIDCHTFFGNGAYYGPDLTKAWLDPVWPQTWMPMTQQKTREDAMVEFLMHPETYPTWSRRMPDLGITREEARAVVAYLKWMSAVDANGFPANFGTTKLVASAGQTPPVTLLSAQGQKAYMERCAACHQADGLGVPGTFPPLAAGKDFSAAEALVEALAQRGFYKDGKIVLGSVKQHLDVVLHGIPGSAMTPFGSQLDDATIAAIVTYERNSFGNHSGDAVEAADVKAARGG